MLPSELLRTRTSRGRIYAQFCSPHKRDSVGYELAERMISVFDGACNEKMRKGDLHDTITEMEPRCDYKLVRGLRTLLERRSEFATRGHAGTEPHVLRRSLFAESSKVGLAVSGDIRESVINRVAAACGVPADAVSDLMWADLDENLILGRFDTISAQDLLFWYNMSLAQTLLFSCTRLEFGIGGDDGPYWKTVLRAVKMQGLMYVLEDNNDAPDDDDERGADAGGGSSNSNNNYGRVRCTLEGPASLLKMTVRYGTSFARMLPIITRTPVWHVDATISKKAGDGTPKLHRFEISSESARDYLRPVLAPAKGEGGQGALRNEEYDSTVEKAFADAMRQHMGYDDALGWQMTREPEPLVSGNKAMIPDFVFERLGRRVYLEIVGFWTPDYIRRKVAKLKDVANNDRVEMLVGIDSKLMCARTSEVLSLPGVFVFERGRISVRPVLDRLREIDAQIKNDAVSTTRIGADDLKRDIMSIRETAHRYGVPESAIPGIIMQSAPGAYVQAGPCMISATLASRVSSELEGLTGFVDACKMMSDAGIPDTAHAELAARLGYDVVWMDLDPANARISKKL